jgi:hypothetical protein
VRVPGVRVWVPVAGFIITGAKRLDRARRSTPQPRDRI